MEAPRRDIREPRTTTNSRFLSEFTIYLVIYLILLQVGKIWNSVLINTNSVLLDLILQILHEPGGNCVMLITDKF